MTRPTDYALRTTHLKHPILNAMGRVSDALRAARAEPGREGLVEKLKIAERQLAVCLGEVEDVTPARFLPQTEDAA